jgi:signal peptidase II
LVQRKTLTVISGFLRFTYAENPGAAWSFLATASPHFRYWFFTLISIIAVTFLLGLAINQTPDNRLALAAYGLILGGAIGNFIDRQTTNYVVDFIDMYIGSSHWPTYNVADIGISVGVSLLLIAMVLERKKEKAA